MSESDQTLSVVRRVFAAFAAHDLDAFRDLLHPDVVLHIGGGPTTLAGIDAGAAAVSVTVRAVPHLRGTVGSAFPPGPLPPPGGGRGGAPNGAAGPPGGTPLPPSGRAVRLPECLMFTVRGGKVMRMAPYVDMLDTLRQLGALPMPGGGSA